MEPGKIFNLQQKYILNFLKSIAKPLNLSTQIIQKILSYLFSSPCRQKNNFVLKKGCYNVKFRNKFDQFFLKRQFSFEGYNQMVINIERKYKIKQNDTYLISNQFNSNERIKIIKFWKKPATRTQKKLITYCPKFKQFIIGHHYKQKGINLNNFNRNFLVNQFQKHLFESDLQNIINNQITLGEPTIIDSYMNLITKNYIQIQIVTIQYKDYHKRNCKIIIQDSQQQILPSLRLVYNENKSCWEFKGQNLVLWKEQIIFSRDKQLIRTIDGKVDLVEGRIIRNIQEIQIQQNYQEK